MRVTALHGLPVLFVMLSLATCVPDAASQDPQPHYGQSVPSMLREMMIERAREANDHSSDMDQYIRVCRDRICRYQPMQGRVVYRTEYGEQVVNYGD